MLMSITLLACAGGGRSYYHGYYQTNPWGYHRYRPIYVINSEPDLPSIEPPRAVTLPELPPVDMPDFGMPADMSGFD